MQILKCLYSLRPVLCNAALYQQDIQHRAHLQRFGNADTHTLEKSYRWEQAVNYRLSQHLIRSDNVKLAFCYHISHIWRSEKRIMRGQTGQCYKHLIALAACQPYLRPPDTMLCPH